jgi:hypothetical protein
MLSAHRKKMLQMLERTKSPAYQAYLRMQNYHATHPPKESHSFAGSDTPGLTLPYKAPSLSPQQHAAGTAVDYTRRRKPESAS